MNGIYLALPVFLPILGGLLLLTFRDKISGEREERMMNLGVEGLVIINSLIILMLLVKLYGAKDSGNLEFTLFRLFGNLTVMFKLDRLGSVFAGLIAFLWPLATLYAFEYMKEEPRKPGFFAFYTMTYGVTTGIAFAGSLITLYLFYELLTLVTFPLVLQPLTREAAHASRTYLYYSLGGAAFAFLGLVLVLGFSATGNTGFVPGGMLNTGITQNQKNILLMFYVLAFFGFGVKAALFPCHGWLPKATVAPTPVTALLHAVAVVKSGAFAILRLTYFSFGAEFLRGTWAQWVVMAAALVTIVYGSTMAVREVHWKRRLAYSTISNLSYILFGVSIMSPFGLAAALCHMVAHAFMKICGFFCAGAVMHQTGKTYIYELDGMGKKMPITFGCFTVSSLSLMGVPLFAGFISKWNLCQAAFEYAGQAVSDNIPGGWFPYAGVAVILYSALMTAFYMLTVVIRAYFPKAESGQGIKKGKDFHDPNWMMLLPLVIFVAVIVAIGLHSAPLMHLFLSIGGEAG
ncbi:MAG: proton-conducting membrane transporter [Hungatella sp.]|nr:proton-conducting membrane transporter [Hungatella sp.]